MSQQQRIRVCVRARPLAPGETALWDIESEHAVLEKHTVSSRKRRVFNFDRVFDEATSNHVVFEEFGVDVMRDVMRGYHGAIVAYGQTSTGKTHTMQGTPEDPGQIPLCIEACFNHIQDEESSQNREYALKVSYVEVYNEHIRDLLGDCEPRLVEEKEGPQLTNVTEARVASIGDVFEAIVAGENKRTVGETQANPRSSRSHAVLRIQVESRDADGAISSGTLSFVDLAGSERARTTSDADRLKEGSYINKSLHALAHVVSKLSSGGGHVPYRDSKLTRLLRPALGGNSRVTLICTVTLGVSDETANTLHFASRAKRVVQAARRNTIVDAGSQLAAYRQQVDDLKRELRKAQEAASQSLGKEERLALVAAVQHLERLILKSGRAPVSPTRRSVSATEDDVPHLIPRFFASSAHCRRSRDRSRTLPPQPLAAPNEPAPPEPKHHHRQQQQQQQKDLGSQLTRIKATIEQVLAREADHSDLLEALDRSRDDTAFVLEQLDLAQAENAKLKAQIGHLSSVVQSRESEILVLKGLRSRQDETF